MTQAFRGWGLVCLCYALTTGLANAQSEPQRATTKNANAVWEGQSVIPRPGITLKAAGSSKALPLKEAGPLPWKITAVNKDWLWMGKAWVKRDQVQRVGDSEQDRMLVKFSEGIRTEPQNLWHYVNRAFVRGPNENEDAIADLTAAIRLDPKNAYVLTTRASRLAAIGRHEEALADYEQAIKVDPANVAARGQYFASIGKWKQALADFDKGIEVSPKDFNLLATRAWLLATCPDDNIRNGTEALEDARAAYALQKWHNTVSALAAAYAELGNFGAAVRAQEAAIELYKQQAPVLLKDAEARLALYRAEKPFRQERGK